MSDRYGLSTIATELHDGVLVVTLNRPERRNSLDEVMHRELRSLYESIVADEEPNAVVLTGAGKYFCVGADFSTMQANVSYPDGHPGLLIDSGIGTWPFPEVDTIFNDLTGSPGGGKRAVTYQIEEQDYAFQTILLEEWKMLRE